MNQSSIVIDVTTDEHKIPESIQWHATGSSIDEPQAAKAFMLSVWDGADKTALRMDIWTKAMMVDEMADFFYQTMMTMADTYQRATQYEDMAQELKAFAKKFYNTFREKQLQNNKA